MNSLPFPTGSPAKSVWLVPRTGAANAVVERRMPTHSVARATLQEPLATQAMGPRLNREYRQRLISVVSAGVVALVISGGASAGRGAGADPARIVAARTAADHEAIAKTYEEEAADLESKAEMHQRMADRTSWEGSHIWSGRRSTAPRS